MSTAMTVMIAEDSVLLREGIVRLLEDCDFTVAGAYGDGDSLIAALPDSPPDLVIMDVWMPPTFTDEGLKAALAIRRSHPDVAVVVLSQYVEQAYVSELLGDSSGKVGYLLKDRVADVDEFVATLERVVAGGTALDPEVVAQLFSRSATDDPLTQLTPRERDVLAKMAEGLTNSGIAQALFVTDGAIEKHVSNIFAKLGLMPTDHDHRRVQAVLTYLESSQ